MSLFIKNLHAFALLNILTENELKIQHKKRSKWQQYKGMKKPATRNLQAVSRNLQPATFSAKKTRILEL